MQALDLHEVVLGAPELGTRAAQCAHRIFEIRRGVGAAAAFAGVAVLVLRATAWAGSLDEAVGEEHTGLGVEELDDLLFDDEPLAPERRPNFGAERAILRRMGAAVVIEAHVEAVEVALVVEAAVADDLFLLATLLARSDHDGGPVRVVGAQVGDAPPAQALEAHPDVGLHVLEHVPEMNGTVRVGQRGRDQQATRHGAASVAGRSQPNEAFPKRLRPA